MSNKKKFEFRNSEGQSDNFQPKDEVGIYHMNRPIGKTVYENITTLTESKVAWETPHIKRSLYFNDEGNILRSWRGETTERTRDILEELNVRTGEKTTLIDKASHIDGRNYDYITGEMFEAPDRTAISAMSIQNAESKDPIQEMMDKQVMYDLYDEDDLEF